MPVMQQLPHLKRADEEVGMPFMPEKESRCTSSAERARLSDALADPAKLRSSDPYVDDPIGRQGFVA